MKSSLSIKVPLFLAVFVVASLLIGVLGRATQAAVTLEYFRATAADPVIAVEWATATEYETSGFYVGRSLSASGPFTRLSSGFIPHQGDGVIGATYILTDTNVQPGIRYYYRLEEIDIHNNSLFYDQYIFSAGIGVPTNTPTPTPTTTRTNTPTPTATATKTNTPTPQPTRDPGTFNFTPTPQGSGLDPNNFTLATQQAAAVTATPVSSEATATLTPEPNAPAPPTTVPAEPTQIAIAPPTVFRSTAVPLPPVAPEANVPTRVSVAPMVVVTPATAAPATTNGSLIGVLAVIILVLGAGGIYAINRRAKSE